MNVDFKIPYMYDFVTKSCRQQAAAIQNHGNVNTLSFDQGKAQHREYKRPKRDGGQVYDYSCV
jgi:hypothetical protein